MKVIKGGITSPKGFMATGNHVGIRKEKKDLALIYSVAPAKISGVFTKNVVKAAPVLWCQDILKKKRTIQAIVVNSGNANSCTGETGKKDTEAMAKKTAQCLNLKLDEVLVSSTGIIGVPLPIEKILKGIEENYINIGSSVENGDLAAEAIMTTDTFTKQIAVEIIIDGKNVVIGGMAKGSGMIHPNMGTMLSYITTDANISYELLNKAFKESNIDSYNMISVDGDTSTNDSAIIMANGLAGNVEIIDENEDYEKLKGAIHYVNLYLAQQIVKDGEGAGKFISVTVKGTKNKEDARKLSKSVITSNLVKTAFFGEDANWGRIVCALGYSGVDFDINKTCISFKSLGSEIYLMKDGIPLEFDEEIAKKVLTEDEITVNISLNEGEEQATAWGCDLSYDYVKINGEYRT